MLKKYLSITAIILAGSVLLAACSSDHASENNQVNQESNETDAEEVSYTSAGNKDEADETETSDTNMENGENVAAGTDSETDEDNKADKHYEKYTNPRFHFSVKYPSSFESDYKPDNNDGIEVHDDKATIIASGSYMSLDGTPIKDIDSIKTIYENNLSDLQNDHHNISYKRLKDDWYVISYTDGNNIVYKKSTISGDHIIDLTIKYPADLQEDYKSVVETVSDSLTALSDKEKD